LFVFYMIFLIHGGGFKKVDRGQGKRQPPAVTATFIHLLITRSAPLTSNAANKM